MSQIAKIILFLFLLINLSHEKRNFELYLNTMICTANPKYISNSNCTLDKSTFKAGQVSAGINFAEEIRQITYSLEIFVVRTNKERFSLVQNKNQDGCKFLAGVAETTLENIYIDVLSKHGNLPRCPIPKDYHLVLTNAKPDPETFPPYLPETDFAVVAEFKTENEFIIKLDLAGSVVQKKKLRRNFELHINTLNCSANPKYVSNINCTIDKSVVKTGLVSAEIKYAAELKKLTYSLEIFLVRSNKERFSLIQIKNQDGCKFLSGVGESTLENIYIEILSKHGNLPKCPIPKGYNLVITNAKPDPEKFPAYLPESDFVVVVEFKTENEFIGNVELDGSIVQKKKLRVKF